MNYYLAGTDVTLTIPLVDDQGRLVIPASASYVVNDSEAVELVASTAIALSDDEDTVNITVPNSVNALADGLSLDVREVKINAVLDDGSTVVIVSRYFIETNSDLIIATNSTLTYAQSLLLRNSFASMPAWDRADERTRKAALVEAFNNLGLLKLRNNEYGADSLRELITEDFSDGSEFVREFRLAQMAEAEQLMGSNGIEDQRRAGILSYSVGEVTQFFRTGKPLELAVRKEALKYVGKYVSLSVDIGRA